MPTQPLLSVIVPVYNIAAYLPRCLDSIIGQNYKNLEIILVDDGATDACPQICDEYAKKDSRIRVIHQPNKGLPGARNRAIEIMQGEFFTFVDADDWLHTDCYQQLIQRQQATNADMVTCPYYYAFDGHVTATSFTESFSEGFSRPERFLFTLLKQQNPFAWNKIYRRSWVSEIRFDPRYTIAEDWFFVSKLAQQGGIATQINCPLYFYYQRQNSMLRTSNCRQWYLAMQLALKLYNKFKKNDFPPLRNELLGSLFSFASAFSLVTLLEKQEPPTRAMKARRILRAQLPKLLCTKNMGLAGKLFAFLFVLFPKSMIGLCRLPGINSGLKKMFSKTR